MDKCAVTLSQINMLRLLNNVTLRNVRSDICPFALDGKEFRDMYRATVHEIASNITINNCMDFENEDMQREFLNVYDELDASLKDHLGKDVKENLEVLQDIMRQQMTVMARQQVFHEKLLPQNFERMKEIAECVPA